jgi:hypothetical protein
MIDNETVIRLHGIAKAVGNSNLRIIADRLRELSKKEQKNGRV